MTVTHFAMALLFSLFFLLLLMRMPIPFALIIATAVTMLYLGIPLMTLVQQMAKAVSNFTLLAVPFFILAGEIMGAGGISNRIVRFADVLVGRWRGGLAQVNVLASMFFGGISGSAVADVSSIGAMMIPMMEKSGYEKDFSVAITVTSSCQGVLIPPSHNMIFYAMASGGVSVAQLFLAGVIPGVMLGVALMIYVAVLSVVKKYPKGGTVTFSEAVRISRDACLALFTAVIIMGGVSFGWFTATESAAVACMYALFISSLIYRELRPADFPRVLMNVVMTLTVSFGLIAAAGAFGWIIAYLQVPKMLATWLIGISHNRYILLVLINLMLLGLGCIMDMAPLIFICTPILLPVARTIGMSPVQFGIVLIFNLAVGLCTPPVGSALFVGCAVGKIAIEKVVRSMWPMYLVMFTVVLLITFFPFFTTWLPKVVAGR